MRAFLASVLVLTMLTACGPQVPLAPPRTGSDDVATGATAPVTGARLQEGREAPGGRREPDLAASEAARPQAMNEAVPGPRDVAAALERARSLLARGEARGALHAATAAVAGEPDSADALALRGRAHLALGMLEEASRDLGRAVERNPRDSHALNDLGCVLLAAKRAEQAIAPLRRAVALVPHLGYVQHNLAIAFEQAGQPALARAARQRARQLEGASPWAAPELSPLSPSALESGEPGGDELVAHGDEELPPGKRPGDDLAGYDFLELAEAVR